MPLYAVDDRDPLITYSSGWSQAGSDKEFNATTTWTQTQGATATISFSGTAVSVYGTIAAGGLLSHAPTSLYTVDTSSPVRFVGSPTLTTQFNQLFFQSANLTDGQHTLTITNAVDDAILFLDLLIITPTSPPSVSTLTTTVTPSNIPSTVTATVSPSDSLLVTTNPQLPSSTAEASSSATQKTNSAAIAGGIIAAILLLILIAFALILCRRRSKRKRQDIDITFYNPAKPTPFGGSVVPFALVTPPPGSHQSDQPDMAYSNRLYRGTSNSRYMNQYSNQYPNQYPNPLYASTIRQPQLPATEYHPSSDESSIPPSKGFGNGTNARYNPATHIVDYSPSPRGVPLPQGSSGFVNELPRATEAGGRVRINLDD